MTKKITFLITAALMLLTMIVSPGRAVGQTRTTQTATYGFETGDTGWTATSFVTNNTAITAHGGSKYGATNSSSTANVTYGTKVANPQSLTCYYSKTTNNTNAGSHFEIQVSTDQSTWTKVEEGLGMDEVTKGTWYELSADLSSYSNVYVRVYYTGTSAVRALDDITLTYDDGQTPSSDPVITFNPTSITLDDVILDNQASATFSVSQANLTSDITLSVDKGNLTTNSITQGAAATSVTWTYTPTAAGAISATVTATSGETSETLSISGNAIAPVEGYDVDFEYATNIYPNWTFVNMESYQTGSITAHGGTYYGTTGGKATASITTTSTVENPGTLTCYVSKQSGNTTASTWYIQVSEDGSSWTEVENHSATSMSQGTWVEFSADLSSYTDVYVRVYYNGSTAIRNIDDLTLTTAAPSNIFTVTYDGNGNTSGSIPTDDNEYESGAEVTVLGNTGNLAKAGYVWAGWNTKADGTGTDRAVGSKFNISENTTLYAKWDAKTITTLTYSGTPTATQYAGQAFNPAGLTVTATFNDESQEDVTSQVVWTPNPLTIETTSVTGTYMEYSVVVEDITVTYAPGTENNPYTVAEAMAATPTSGTSASVYIHGIVSAFYNTSIVGDGSNYRYYISDDGTTTSQLLVYKGKGLNNVAFSNADDLMVGDIVVIYGGLTTYQNAPEIASGNYLYSWERPAVDVEAPTFSVAAGGYAETQTVAITCATEGAQIYYTKDGSDPTNESFLYDEEIDIEETTTIKAIAYVGENASTVNTAAYYILSNENTYTVTQALEFETYPQNNIFVEGIVSTAPTSLLDGGLLTYYISVDGTETNRLQVYKGKNLGNTEFTAQDNIQFGDRVTIFGNVKTYNEIKEFDQGNYLVTWERLETVATPTFTPEEDEYTEAQSVTIACATEGATIYYKTAENAEWAVYSEAINVTETTTIWAYAAKEGMNNSAVATATYTINLPEPSITVTPDAVNATAEGGNENLTVTCANMGDSPELAVQFYTATSTPTTCDWINTAFNAGNLVLTVQANASDARTAYLKVYSGEVYSNLVTINQAAGTTPSNPYVRINNLGSLTDGSKVIIAARYDNEHTNGYYAMPGETSGKPNGVAFTSTTSGDNEILPATITSDEDTYYWTVNVTNDGYTFTNANSQMIGYSSSTNFATGGNNTEWTITFETAESTAMVAEYTGFVIRNANTNTRAFAFNGTAYGAYATTNMSSSTYNFFLDFFVQGATPIVTPSITVNPATLTGFVYAEGNGPSESQNITVSGNYLTNDITVALSTESSFEMKLGEGVWTNSLTLTQTDGSVASTTINVRMKSDLSAGNYNNTISVTSGELSESVTLSGTVNAAPSSNTYNLVTSLTPGLHYIIVSSNANDEYFAMGGQNQNGDYRDPIDINVSENSTTISSDSGVTEVVISGNEGHYTLHTTEGFLKGGNKKLKNDGTVNDTWSITINNSGVATISYGDYSIKYNSSATRFTCYASGQCDIYLYKKVGDTNPVYYSPTEITMNDPDPTSEPIIVVNNEILILTGDLSHCDNPDMFIIQDGGQVINTNDNPVSATLQKNITAASLWKDDVDGWYFIASPVDNLSTNAVTGSGSGTYDLFAYDEPNAYWRSNTGTGAPFTELERGKGYLYANKDDVTLNFAGMMVSTNESISLPLSYACEYTDVKGYNLMGNPFTRNLTTGDITKGGVALTTYYGINAATTGMEAKLIANEPIKPGQGFFVQVESTDANHILVFNPSKKDETVDNGYICIAAENDNNMDKAYVQIQNGNTLRKMNIANLMEVYVMNEGDDYAAARVEELAGTMPVHFKAVTDGEYTITINAKNIEASTMMLFDDFTGEQIDLLETPSYTFFANESDDAARFTLMFDFNDYTGVNESYVNGNFAYQNGDELFVSGDGTLQVFDVMGRFVMSKEIHGSESVSISAFNTGVYMLRFVGENIMTQKIVVR